MPIFALRLFVHLFTWFVGLLLFDGLLLFVCLFSWLFVCSLFGFVRWFAFFAGCFCSLVCLSCSLGSVLFVILRVCFSLLACQFFVCSFVRWFAFVYNFPALLFCLLVRFHSLDWNVVCLFDVAPMLALISLSFTGLLPFMLGFRLLLNIWPLDLVRELAFAPCLLFFANLIVDKKGSTICPVFSRQDYYSVIIPRPLF